MFLITWTRSHWGSWTRPDVTDSSLLTGYDVCNISVSTSCSGHTWVLHTPVSWNMNRVLRSFSSSGSLDWTSFVRLWGRKHPPNIWILKLKCETKNQQKVCSDGSVTFASSCSLRVSLQLWTTSSLNLKPLSRPQKQEVVRLCAGQLTLKQTMLLLLLFIALCSHLLI